MGPQGSQQRRCRRPHLIAFALPLLARSASAFVQPRVVGTSSALAGGHFTPKDDCNRRSFSSCAAAVRKGNVHDMQRDGRDTTRRVLLSPLRRHQRPVSGMTEIGAKKRKRQGVSDSSSWYDDDDQEAVDDNSTNNPPQSPRQFSPPAGAMSTSPTAEMPRQSSSPLPPAVSGGSAALGGTDELEMLEDADVLPPLVETYGLDQDVADTFGAESMGLTDYSKVVSMSDGDVDDSQEGGFVGAGANRNTPWNPPTSMDVPDDDMMRAEGMSTATGRGLDDMLMERSLRFYDPKVTGERERCYLVGLEASGFNTGSGKRGTRGAFPEARAERESDNDDDWDDEMEAAYQQEKRDAYEARKEEREMRFSLEESMAELSELAGTAGLEVAGSTYQRVLEPNPRTYIGTGKVKEIKAAMGSLSVCTVIFDDELSPGQQRSLEAEFGGEAAGIKVLDRTALILDIFAQHARTKEGQLQVELALHMYRLPRLTKLWTHLERQQGGVGLRGPGERQLEVDRRMLKDKIMDLKSQLGDVSKHRDLQRRSRKKLGLPVIALVGYTNAGKSTLLNSLTRAGVMAENMLFATLDPTTRKVKLTGLKVHPEVMLTDTVGFIQKLPTNLVAAFRATLEEVVEADVIVHIVDVSSPSSLKQESAVTGVLGEMGVLDKPRMIMWNKLDLVPEEEQDEIRMDAVSREQLTVAASAKTGIGMDDFVAVLEEAITSLLMDVEAVVPYNRGDLLSRVHELGACDVEEYTEAGTYIMARVPQELMNRLEPYFTDGFKEKRLEMGRARVGDSGVLAQQEEIDWKLIAKKRVKEGTT